MEIIRRALPDIGGPGAADTASQPRRPLVCLGEGRQLFASRRRALGHAQAMAAIVKARKLDAKRANDALAHLVLHGEDVANAFLVAFGPKSCDPIPYQPG